MSPTRAWDATLWHDRTMHTFLNARHGPWLVIRREHVRPTRLPNGVYRDPDRPNVFHLADADGIGELVLRPAAMLASDGPWHPVKLQGRGLHVRIWPTIA